MKAFEKWQYKHKYYMCADGFQSGIKEGWKAALEWVFDGKIELREHIRRSINKELEED